MATIVLNSSKQDVFGSCSNVLQRSFFHGRDRMNARLDNGEGASKNTNLTPCWLYKVRRRTRDNALPDDTDFQTIV